MYFCLKSFFEKRSHVEVMVAFKINDVCAAFPYLPEHFEDGKILREGDFSVSYPEFEEIAKDVKNVGVAF